MAPKLFLTGVTGYIGGTAFNKLVESHPDYDITVLLRNTPADFTSKYPNVKIVEGDYDSANILTTQASKADIVIHCGDSDHLAAISALLAGVEKADGYFIHLSGTGSFSDFVEPDFCPGTLNPKVWSDIADISEILAMPKDRVHQPTDSYIQNKAVEKGVKTAIVCPGPVYGMGTGPGRVSAMYWTMLLGEAEKLDTTFYVGDGANSMGWVHVVDLADVFVKLVENAAIGGGKVTWGNEGYFFTSADERSQKQNAEVIGKYLHRQGYISTPKPKAISVETCASMLAEYPIPRLGLYAFASSARTTRDRAAKELGWIPRAPSLDETMAAEIKTVKKGKH